MTPQMCLSLAIGNYARTTDSLTGGVRPAGIDLKVIGLPFEEAALRFAANLNTGLAAFGGRPQLLGDHSRRRRSRSVKTSAFA